LSDRPTRPARKEGPSLNTNFSGHHHQTAAVVTTARYCCCRRNSYADITNGTVTTRLVDHRSDAKHFIAKLSRKYINFVLSIAQNPSEFWQNSPYNTASSWRQIGDENHVIKLIKSSQNRENAITGRKTRTEIYTSSSYRKETTLQGALVLAKSGRLEMGDNILRAL